MKVLSKRQILLIHEQLIRKTGGSQGLRDEGLLESALAAPFQSFDGEDAFPSIYQKAARLGYGLIKNHPFVDGNKRIGTHIMLVFLALNDITLAYTQEDLTQIILAIAASKKKYEDLLKWLLEHTP